MKKSSTTEKSSDGDKGPLSEKTLTVYQSGKSGYNFLEAQRKAAEEIFRARHLIWQMFRRDFTSRFRQSLLGYFWAFLTPFLGVLGFLVMYLAGVLKPGDTGVSYPAFAMFGTSVWALLPGSMAAVSAGLQTQADLVMRTNIPKMALAMSTLASFFYGVIISLITILLVSFLSGAIPSIWALFYPFLIFPLLAFGVGIGLVLAVVGTIARDITSMVSTGFGFMIYIMPVAYTGSATTPALAEIIRYNPFSYLIQVPRDIFYFGRFNHLAEFLTISVFSIFCLAAGIYLFYRVQDLVAERL